MSRDRERQLSRTISHALRHAPHLYELELDEQGWTSVAHLLDGLRAHRRAWRSIDLDTLRGIVERDSKGRYELDEERGQIRALYGHSTATKLAKEEAAPPEVLYHGTSPQTATIILQEGLKPMARQYVHHSVDTSTALEVGRRKDHKPTMLRVLALEAHQAGVKFYRGNDLIWLSDAVPPRFIARDEQER